MNFHTPLTSFKHCCRGYRFPNLEESVRNGIPFGLSSSQMLKTNRFQSWLSFQLLVTITGGRSTSNGSPIPSDRRKLRTSSWHTLVKKYGKDRSLLEELLFQLETCEAEGTSTRQQANLLERVTAILMQLSIKGQDINQRLVLNLVLRKSNVDIQTKVLEKRESAPESMDWIWSVLQKNLSDIITTKEKVERAQAFIRKAPTPPLFNRDRTLEKGLIPICICIYCKRNNYRSLDCRTVPMNERAAFLVKKRLCINCGKPNHTAQDCRSPVCFKCGQKFGKIFDHI